MHSSGHLREHSSLLSWLMRLLDLLVALAACGVGYIYVFGLRPLPAIYVIAILSFILLFAITAQLFGLYRAWRGVDFLQELTVVLMAWTTIFSILIFLSVITKTSASYSRAWLLIFYTLGGANLLLSRYTIRKSLSYLRSKGFNLRHIVLIGSGESGDRVFNKIAYSTDTGFNLRGYYSDSDTLLKGNASINTGSVEQGIKYLAANQVDQIWLAMPLSQSDRIEEILHQLRNSTADIRLIPDLQGYRLINHSISNISGMSVINLSASPMNGANRWIKAVEDKLLSSIFLLLCSPLFLIIAILIKVSSPGPVFYAQKRLSWNGREFSMYKFRTMPTDIEAKSGPVWATNGENRATGIGRVLRKTSLDELPQFWNVLKGDMSIVGPRPERKVFVDKFKNEVPSYMQKHMVKAGITGWAQVNGWRGDTDIKARIEHDLYYIDNWSLWLDLKIILMTVFKGFIHKNAY